MGPDKQIIITDIPKLNESDGLSASQKRSGSMALSCITVRLTNPPSRTGRSPAPRGEFLGREKTNLENRALGQSAVRINPGRSVTLDFPKSNPA